jgi:hypothetical protein
MTFYDVHLDERRTVFLLSISDWKIKGAVCKYIFPHNRTLISVSFITFAGYMMFQSPLETLSIISIGGINTAIGIASVRIQFCACLRSC